MQGPILKKYLQVQNRLWLSSALPAVFIVTCALGVAVVLDLLQLHMHSVIPCLFSLPTEPSSEGLQVGDYVCAGGLTF